MICVRYILTCLLAILPTTVLAQSESININGKIVWLGMNQSEVLNKLKEASDVWEIMPQNHYCVQPKDHAGQRDCTDFVGFKNDKLYTASTEFGTSTDTTTASVLNRLYSAISQAEKSGKPVQIQTGPESELAQTSQRIRTLKVLVGSKLYSIQIEQPVGIPGPSYTSLSETIRDTPQPTTAK